MSAFSPSSMARRGWLRQLCAGLACSAVPAFALSQTPKTATPIEIEVWKDPTCGCCQDWIDHMHANGFRAKVRETGNTAVRERLGLPASLGSCHTALVNGYLVEGHVPASDVHKLLTEKPKALGITVPGMPIGSPGMDGPQYNGVQHPYDVLLVTKNRLGRDVSTRIFTSYRQPRTTA